MLARALYQHAKLLSLALVLILSSGCGVSDANLATPETNRQPDVGMFTVAFTSLPLREILELPKTSVLSTNYRENVGNPRMGPIDVTILDREGGTALAEIVVAPYGTLYSQVAQYASGTGMVGSRSFTTNSRDKGDNIVVSQLYMSTSNRRWDVFISRGAHEDGIPLLTNLATQIDRWLCGGK